MVYIVLVVVNGFGGGGGGVLLAVVVVLVVDVVVVDGASMPPLSSSKEVVVPINLLYNILYLIPDIPGWVGSHRGLLTKNIYLYIFTSNGNLS